jgi:hypothetical protein
VGRCAPPVRGETRDEDLGVATAVRVVVPHEGAELAGGMVRRGHHGADGTAVSSMSSMKTEMIAVGAVAAATECTWAATVDIVGP